METSNSYPFHHFSKEEWQTCIKVLMTLKEQPYENPDNQLFSGLISKIYKTAKKQKTEHTRLSHKIGDFQSVLQTEIVRKALNNTSSYQAEEKQAENTYIPLNKPKNCYACNQAFKQLHFFYHRLCPKCATYNYQMRSLELNLSGRNVILTGGRIKIGYATALKLLRSNANVVVTTRFPALALKQFQAEDDYFNWKNRLWVYGLDLRNLKAVHQFVDYVAETFSHIDILINNAAQTIQYDTVYYAPLIAEEQQLLSSYEALAFFTPNSTAVLQEVAYLEAANQEALPALNRFGQPIDYREKTSWNSTLEEISVPELLEVNLINQISPYLLIQGFTPLFKTSPFEQQFIINVSSSEGQFSYSNKTIYHPHTNMTKAALNMLTRTSAKEYAAKKVYMNAVDVGWVSTGAHESKRKTQFEKGQIPPLDPVDGAIRILHPIYENIVHGKRIYGKLIKNYQITSW